MANIVTVQNADLNKERQRAVRLAWKRERAAIRIGKGTRDWSLEEQKQIVGKGSATGYEGHHMKSVKMYPEHASDPNNIQFLNRTEHIQGAHAGNTKNMSNGYYDPKTCVMHDFGRGLQAPHTRELSATLTQRQQNLAVKREQAKKQAAAQAKAEIRQAVSKIDPQQPQEISTVQTKSANVCKQIPLAQPETNKGIESAREEMAKRRSSASTAVVAGSASEIGKNSSSSADSNSKGSRQSR